MATKKAVVKPVLSVAEANALSEAVTHTKMTAKPATVRRALNKLNTATKQAA